MKEFQLLYDPKLKLAFRAKTLQKKWRKQYPPIFDDEDLRLALKTPKYHFGEWFVAIHFAKKGFGVLVEKYRSYKIHRQKYEKLFDYLTKEEVDFLTDRSKPQPPDLFIYKYKNKKFFFVEVKDKSSSDRLREPQEKFFKDIEKKLKCKVYVCHLKAADRK